MGRTQAYQPLQLVVGNVSQMILPPLASELDSAAVPVRAADTVYAYGAIVRSGASYYWCVAPGTTSAVPNLPNHADGDAADGTVTWRRVRWHRDVLTLVNVAGVGAISIARGTPAVINNGITLFGAGVHNEGYGNDLKPYGGAWFGVSDDAGGRALAISEG
jgi:hypothetical protein